MVPAERPPSTKILLQRIVYPIGPAGIGGGKGLGGGGVGFGTGGLGTGGFGGVTGVPGNTGSGRGVNGGSGGFGAGGTVRGLGNTGSGRSGTFGGGGVYVGPLERLRTSSARCSLSFRTSPSIDSRTLGSKVPSDSMVGSSISLINPKTPNAFPSAGEIRSRNFSIL
jgi:hypothetical protein